MHPAIKGNPMTKRLSSASASVLRSSKSQSLVSVKGEVLGKAFGRRMYSSFSSKQKFPSAPGHI